MRLALTAILTSSILLGIFLQPPQPRFIHILAETERPAERFHKMCLMVNLHTSDSNRSRSNEVSDIDPAQERSKIVDRRTQYINRVLGRLESAKIPCQVRILSALDTLSFFVEEKNTISLTNEILKIPTVRRVLIIDDLIKDQPKITTVSRAKSDIVTIIITGVRDCGSPYPVLRFETPEYELMAPIISGKAKFYNIPDGQFWGRLSVEDPNYSLESRQNSIWINLRATTMLKLISKSESTYDRK